MVQGERREKIGNSVANILVIYKETTKNKLIPG